jgi:hypothetical protein
MPEKYSIKKYLPIMKKIILSLLVLTMAVPVIHAQDEEPEKPSFKENLFTGGSITVSVFNGVTILGASPILGYKIANFMDAGLVFNYTYGGQRDVKEFDDRYRQHVYGGGVFTRIYPVNFLFAQAQLEHNFTKFKYIPTPGSVFYAPSSGKVDATSFLVGGGYAQGRGPGSNTFYYISVLFDVIKDINSPYVEIKLNPNTGEYVVRGIPIFRAGMNIALFQGRY